MDQSDHLSRGDEGRNGTTVDGAGVGAMSEQVRDALRRRFLVGGAVAAPLVVTFGRRAMAQAAISPDCFTKASITNPNPQDPQGPTVALDTTRANLMSSVGGALNPDGTPANGVADTVDGLILSAGGTLDTVNGVFKVTAQTNGGCLASNGITVLTDI